MQILNRDYQNWEKTMAPQPTGFAPTKVTRVRPGHADLAGALKFGFDDVRNVLERASARETTSRVAAGGRHSSCSPSSESRGSQLRQEHRQGGCGGWREVDWDDGRGLAGARTPDAAAAQGMVRAIDQARAAGDTLGGVFTVVATGVPPGLGTYTQWDAA